MKAADYARVPLAPLLAGKTLKPGHVVCSQPPPLLLGKTKESIVAGDPTLAMECKKEFSIVVAIQRANYGIGNAGGLPWPRCKEDLARFRAITTSKEPKNVVIMGRRTYESLPTCHRPLPDRVNVVVTSNVVVGPHACVPTLNAALLEKSCEGTANIFVIGGSRLYEEALHHPACKRMYVTWFATDYPCDTFFPHIDKEWVAVTDPIQSNLCPFVTDPIQSTLCQFVVYERRPLVHS